MKATHTRQANKAGYKHKPSKYPSKLARAIARSENVYGGKRDKGLKR
jgi:hypothetical protein